jgi:hypothetical protein
MLGLAGFRENLIAGGGGEPETGVSPSPTLAASLRQYLPAEFKALCAMYPASTEFRTLHIKSHIEANTFGSRVLRCDFRNAEITLILPQKRTLIFNGYLTLWF